MSTDDLEHFGSIARRPSAPRRQILGTVRSHGPMTPGDIAAKWRIDEPRMGTFKASRLDQIVSQSVWKLHRLGMVTIEDGFVIMTQAGEQALSIGGDDA